jgi:hypothetical protein
MDRVVKGEREALLGGEYMITTGIGRREREGGREVRQGGARRRCDEADVMSCSLRSLRR